MSSRALKLTVYSLWKWPKIRSNDKGLFSLVRYLHSFCSCHFISVSVSIDGTIVSIKRGRKRLLRRTLSRARARRLYRYSDSRCSRTLPLPLRLCLFFSFQFDIHHFSKQIENLFIRDNDYLKFFINSFGPEKCRFCEFLFKSGIYFELIYSVTALLPLLAA